MNRVGEHIFFMNLTKEIRKSTVLEVKVTTIIQANLSAKSLSLRLRLSREKTFGKTEL